MTNGAKIWLRKGLDYLGRKFVLQHEIEHVRDMHADEDTVDRRAMTRLGNGLQAGLTAHRKALILCHLKVVIWGLKLPVME